MLITICHSIIEIARPHISVVTIFFKKPKKLNYIQTYVYRKLLRN